MKALFLSSFLLLTTLASAESITESTVNNAVMNESVEASTGYFTKKYRNISFVQKTFTPSSDFWDLNEMDSEWGVSFTTGRTYFLHKTPILNLIKFGIDATWFDIDYSQYTVKQIIDLDQTDKETMYHLDLGMQVGPSVTLNPVSKMNVAAYFRYAPTLSGMYFDENGYYGYGSYFVSGLSVSYKHIGLGIERKWGDCKFNTINVDEDNVDYEDEHASIDDMVTTKKGKDKSQFGALRVYVTFRF